MMCMRIYGCMVLFMLWFMFSFARSIVGCDAFFSFTISCRVVFVWVQFGCQCLLVFSVFRVVEFYRFGRFLRGFVCDSLVFQMFLAFL